jgi:hypothetical protein
MGGDNRCAWVRSEGVSFIYILYREIFYIFQCTAFRNIPVIMDSSPENIKDSSTIYMLYHTTA